MAILNTVALALIAISITVFASTLFWLIRKSVHQGHEVREQLSEQLDKLPISQLLSKLGLDRNHFVHQVTTIEIQNGITRCENCENLEQCNECLKQSDVAMDQIAFCPNQNCLKDFVQTLETSGIEPEPAPAT